MAQNLTYTKYGDYYIPKIRLEYTGTQTLGKYGRMRRAFLKQNKPMLFNDMILSETLFPHLWEVQQTCEKRMGVLRNVYPKKNIYYYFLNVLGNVDTSYQKFIYRLMNTVGFVFLNDLEAIGERIQPFNSIEDIMFNRRINTGRNQSNNPTYITKSSSRTIEVYGKTFGANKYETSLLCYALAMLCQREQNIKLYQVVEGNLTILPNASLEVIRQMGKIELIQTDMRLEKIQFEDNNSLRSPRYTYNLLNKLGKKHCALCNCEIPELIQGAHIWPVSAIKKAPALTMEQRLGYALDGENGLWLCENHHKMFDEDLITFDQNGRLLFHNNIDRRHMRFIDEITKYHELPGEVVTEQFLWYLWQRHRAG